MVQGSRGKKGKSGLVEQDEGRKTVATPIPALRTGNKNANCGSFSSLKASPPPLLHPSPTRVHSAGRRWFSKRRADGNSIGQTLEMSSLDPKLGTD